MEKTITFNIPKGYVIDKENSTDTNIVLKFVESVKPKSWEEYCKMMEGKKSFCITRASNGKVISGSFFSTPFICEFDDEEDTKAFYAFSKLRKLRKAWIGEWKPDWTNIDQIKFTIVNQENRVVVCTNDRSCRSMSFPTKEMRDDFFDCFKDYLEQAKDLI